MDKSNYFSSLFFLFYSTYFLYSPLFAKNYEPNSPFFCLVDSVGNVSKSCTGPKLIKSNLNTFSGLYTNVQKKSLTFIRNVGNNYNVTVLEGVTGSGKTLDYFERIKDFVRKGLQV